MTESLNSEQSARQESLRVLPSVDRVLAWPEVEPLCGQYGMSATTAAARTAVDRSRERILGQERLDKSPPDTDHVQREIVAAMRRHLDQRFSPPLKPVFNLTGTVIHTNLGRAPLAPSAIAEMTDAATAPTNLEFDLDTGRRGDRDTHVEAQVCRLTGAEAATVVNNNAAAVLLVLNTLARRKEVIVSRGELVEIGGAFRIPDVMQRAGAKLREIGTTNRTHTKDYAEAIDARTAMIMKIHTSNYEVRGFTKAVPETEMAEVAREAGIPFVVDLGSGMLVDLAQYGLPHEPTAQEALAAGADLVTFSGDKLLGGPQAGIIAGRRDLVAKIKKNPMKRALRLDKLVIAALSATLRLYEDPEQLRSRLPVLRLLTRPLEEIEAAAERLRPSVAAAMKEWGEVDLQPCSSQIGSGALPVDLLPSVALAIRPSRGGGGALKRLAAALRELPRPVVGRIADGRLLLDLRCLEDETGFVEQLGALPDPKGHVS